jgi:hypothetical protein
MNSIRILFFFTIAFPNFSRADMGSIPFKEGVRISEPQQDAIIAWNGEEELMYLQTTLAASEATRILEVMPLPNKPVVDTASPGVFKRCAVLMPRGASRSSKSDSPFGEPDGRPVAKVVERKRLGAHDIRIVELINAERFAAWVAEEFSKYGWSLEIPKRLLAVLDEYAKDGFRWFFFDVVNVKKELAKKTPLRIRFATDVLYYPLRITKTEKGQTTVALSIITNVLFDPEDSIGIPRDAIRVPARPKEISGADLRWIDPPLFELLGRPKTAQLRSWTISGEIDSFAKDLLIRKAERQEPASVPR